MPDLSAGKQSLPTENPTWLLKRPQWIRALFGPGKPVYRLPWLMLPRVTIDALLGRRRDVRVDMPGMVARMPVPPVIEGVEHIPTSGRCMILPNHYERPDGVWVGWGVMAILAALGARRPGLPAARWVMTSTWQDCYLGPRRIAPERLRWILERFARVYGLILMPASDAETAGRGVALRNLLKTLGEPDQAVGLHAEAGGFETLIEPPLGIGRVLSLIDRQGIPCIPVGVFEQDRRLHVRFGVPLPAGTLARLPERESAYAVMRAIARLLPPENRGVFAETIDDDAPAPGLALSGAVER
ncbi:MAG TPA: hypothetical protein VFI42_08655 [Thermomicrobiaceae bacterium]|nr:hypothetical protein [Thermomicrobiaceae bacterium]